MISDLATHSTLPWLIEGDLNEIFYNIEKKGGPLKSLCDLDNFQNTLIDYGLFYLGYSAYDFTWCNYRTCGAVVEERLDRVCTNTDWSLLFPDAQVSRIDFDLSDHLPILWKCKLRGANTCSKKRRFQFENMWILEPSCKDVIMLAWSSTQHADVVDNIMGRLNACGVQLMQWNKDFFGNVFMEITNLEKQLKSLKDAPSQRTIL